MTILRNLGGNLVGAPGYRAPEVTLRGLFNSKVDIWGIGCILHELLTRKMLFSSDRDTVYESNLRDSRSASAFDRLWEEDLLDGFEDWKRRWILTTIESTLSLEPDNRPVATSLKGVFNEMMSR